VKFLKAQNSVKEKLEQAKRKAVTSFPTKTKAMSKSKHLDSLLEQEVKIAPGSRSHPIHSNHVNLAE
jgi:hypothetical protein